MTAGTDPEIARLDARADEVDDEAEVLAGRLIMIIGCARGARVDLEALRNAILAARYLQADPFKLVRAVNGKDLLYNQNPHRKDTDLLDDVTLVIADLADLHASLTAMQHEAKQAIDKGHQEQTAARAALARARAMGVSNPCDGCHADKAAAIDEATTRLDDARRKIADARALLDRIEGYEDLEKARWALERVPDDLRDRYDEAYKLVETDPNAMPNDGNFLTPEGAGRIARRSAKAGAR